MNRSNFMPLQFTFSVFSAMFVGNFTEPPVAKSAVRISDSPPELTWAQLVITLAEVLDAQVNFIKSRNESGISMAWKIQCSKCSWKNIIFVTIATPAQKNWWYVNLVDWSSNEKKNANMTMPIGMTNCVSRSRSTWQIGCFIRVWAKNTETNMSTKVSKPYNN